MNDESRKTNRVDLAQLQEAIEAERQHIIEDLTKPKAGDQFSSVGLVVANRARREWEATALRWRDKNRELERELRELQHTLDIVHEANMRAVTRWRMSNPGKECVIPDRGELLGWLIDQLQEREVCLTPESQ